MSCSKAQKNYIFLPIASFCLHQAKIYLKGGENFCSTADAGQLALIGVVVVQPDDAKSVTVPIVPKITGEIEVEVASIFQTKLFGDSWVNNAADAVRRKLVVVVRMFLRQIFFRLRTAELYIDYLLLCKSTHHNGIK